MRRDAIADTPIEFRLGVVLIMLVAAFFSLSWRGHLLTWDEAMNLNAARAFASGGSDAYSSWFWRYPPLLQLLLQLLSPLKAGLMARAELLAIGIHLAMLAAFIGLMKLSLGRVAALASGLLLAVMPGSVFFSLWIKQDVLMSLFGLLALIAYAKRLHLVSGITLGLAFLSKETAIFYALAIASLWFVQPKAERKWKDIFVVAGTSILVAGWWFILFSSSLAYHLSSVKGAAADGNTTWDRPWSYYFEALPYQCGMPAIILAVCGAVILLMKWHKGHDALQQIRLWPVALFVPALVILTVSGSKTPWYTLCFFASIAALAGVGVSGIYRLVVAREQGKTGKAKLAAGAAMLMAFLLTTQSLQALSYEDRMFRMEPGMSWAATCSREAAMKLNALVKPGERVIVTPMHYYPAAVQVPCPIFVHYLKEMEVVVKPNTISQSELVDAVMEYETDWAMVSPPPLGASERLLTPLARHHGLPHWILKGAVIFKTTNLYITPEMRKAREEAR